MPTITDSEIETLKEINNLYFAARQHDVTFTKKIFGDLDPVDIAIGGSDQEKRVVISKYNEYVLGRKVLERDKLLLIIEKLNKEIEKG